MLLAMTAKSVTNRLNANSPLRTSLIECIIALATIALFLPLVISRCDIKLDTDEGIT